MSNFKNKKKQFRFSLKLGKRDYSRGPRILMKDMSHHFVCTEVTSGWYHPFETHLRAVCSATAAAFLTSRFEKKKVSFRILRSHQRFFNLWRLCKREICVLIFFICDVSLNKRSHSYACGEDPPKSAPCGRNLPFSKKTKSRVAKQRVFLVWRLGVTW